MQKVTLYKDTIKKQEKVIVKMEALLDRTLKETQRAREGVLELEQLKAENMELQAAARGQLVDKSEHEENGANENTEDLKRKLAE